MPLKLEDSNLTLWQVTIELHKRYPKSEYSSEKAEEHFMSISDGIEPACDLEEDEWHLYSEVSYYICDSGDGDNILNDTIVMMKDDGINTDELWNRQWEWDKLTNYEDNELEIGLKSVDLKLVDGFLIGDEEILDSFNIEVGKEERVESAKDATTLEELEKLAKDENEDVRYYVAENEYTSVSLLEKLAEDEDVFVRRNVAVNTNIPVSLLEELVKDEDSIVRKIVAENANTPASMLDKLAEDENEDVRKAVTENPNFTSK